VDPTRRFSTRVENYLRYRPSYPAELLPLLENVIGLKRSDVVADIGSGTGKLSETFLRNGNPVIGVEPNREMREAGERLLGQHAEFRCVAARAEATTLDAASVDVVVAGQAFHWFDFDRARVEFLRILRPSRRVALIWNVRRQEATPLMADYEALLDRYGTDYRQVTHQRTDADAIDRFFGPEGCRLSVLQNQQRFDLEGLRGRLLSSSYAPEPVEAGHAEMLAELERLFEEHARGGRVVFEYDTKVYSGSLHEGRG
jgi:SAM-dependent methyltransferase